MFLGELISIAVCVLWSCSALFGQVAARGVGNAMPLNVMRMGLSLLLLALSLAWTIGIPFPVYADGETWLWLTLSGLTGYVLGDYCLFNAYIIIGARFGQLFMTLAPPTAALSGWILLGERMTPMALLGMMITISGIALSIMGKKELDSPKEQNVTTPLQGKSGNTECSSRVCVKGLGGGATFPLKGILFGIGAGVGQGVGLVLSKLGLEHYETCIKTALSDDPTALNDMLSAMPMAATFIRAITGLLCFTLAMFFIGQQGAIPRSLKQGRLMLVILLATITGPFVGVSLSLKATLYTSTGIAQTIMACTPILILWPCHVLFKQQITLREVIGAVISVLGVAMFFI